MGSTTIASLLIRPVSGMILDKMGRKGILIGGLCILILAALVYNWLPSVSAIIVVRFLHGLGWGMASTAGSTIASDKIPKQRFGEGMGFFSLSSSLAIALTPSIGLGMLAAYGFIRLIFFSAGFSVAVLLLSIFIKDNGKTTQKADFKKMIPYERASIFPSAIMFFASATYGSLTGFYPCLPPRKI